MSSVKAYESYYDLKSDNIDELYCAVKLSKIAGWENPPSMALHAKVTNVDL